MSLVGPDGKPVATQAQANPPGWEPRCMACGAVDIAAQRLLQTAGTSQTGRPMTHFSLPGMIPGSTLRFPLLCEDCLAALGALVNGVRAEEAPLRV